MYGNENKSVLISTTESIDVDETMGTDVADDSSYHFVSVFIFVFFLFIYD